MRPPLAIAALALAGCGSAPLPPPAGPAGRAAAGDGLVATVAPRARRLVLRDASGRAVAAAPAGVGPTDVACLAGRCYVLDRQGHGLLLFSVRPLELLRRQYLRARPGTLRLDRRRRLLLITLPARGTVAEYSADARPHLVRERS